MVAAKVGLLISGRMVHGESAISVIEYTFRIAKFADISGFSRIWLGEFHNIDNAWADPLQVLPMVGSITRNIRIGTGASLISIRPPISIAEGFSFLSTLFPNRIDCGLGGAFADPEIVSEYTGRASLSLSSNISADFKARALHLFKILNKEYPTSSRMIHGATPIGSSVPEIWLLGVTESKRILASEWGTKYCYSLSNQRSKADPDEIRKYKENFITGVFSKNPFAAVEIEIFCAESEQEAKAYSKISKNPQRAIIGNPSQCLEQLCEILRAYSADEIILKVSGATLAQKERAIWLVKEATRGWGDSFASQALEDHRDHFPRF